LDNNQQGEICTKLQSKFLGYFNEPQKSKEAFDGEWFKTGDIGYFDDEGFMYIADRKKEMLRYQGFQVTPTELEGIINEIKGVVSSCVVGVFDAVNSNDIIHAFVIPHESSELTEEFIHEHVNGKVIDQKRIRGGVHFVKTFQLLLTGKINRGQMKKMAAEMLTNNSH
jgi:4-coumarate--CoA ligase